MGFLKIDIYGAAVTHSAHCCGEIKSERKSGLWSLRRMMDNAAWQFSSLVDDARSGFKKQPGQDNPSGGFWDSSQVDGAKMELAHFSYVCLLFRYILSGQPEPWTAQRKVVKRRLKILQQKMGSCLWAKHFWTISKFVFWIWKWPCADIVIVKTSDCPCRWCS